MSTLMIDDNAFFARHVQGMCEPSGGEWITAATAGEGLTLARASRPGVILLDPTLHADESRLEAYCRQLALAVLPASVALLLLHHPLQRFDGVLARLAACPNLSVDSLAKPFETGDLRDKIAHLRRPDETPPPVSMPNTAASPDPRFAWVSTVPEVAGYAHIGADGGVLEWQGGPADEAAHGALIYLLRLAGLCGEELGLGPVQELQTLGREGSCLAVELGQGSFLNVLASPRANLRALGARARQ